MKLNFIVFTILLLVFSSVVAQKNFYEQLRENGDSAVYVTFHRNTDPMTEIYKPKGPFEEINIKLLEIDGIPIGFEAFDVKTGERKFGFDEVQNYGRADHYPITKVIKHKYDSEGYAMINGSLYKFKAGKDNSISPQELWAVYVLKRKEPAEDVKEEKPKKEKGFFKKIRALKSNVSGGSKNEERQYLNSLDFESLVTGYSHTMNNRQSSYTLTAKDKADLKKIEEYRKKGKEFVKRYNDSIYNSPSEVEKRRKWAIINAGTKLVVKNNKSQDIWVSSSNNNHANTKISAGGEGSLDCRSDLFYFFTENKNAKAYKFYDQNSACGSSVTIN